MKRNNIITLAVAAVAIFLAGMVDAQEDPIPDEYVAAPEATSDKVTTDGDERLTYDAVKKIDSVMSEARQVFQDAKDQAGMAQAASKGAEKAAKNAQTASEAARDSADAAQTAAENAVEAVTAVRGEFKDGLVGVSGKIDELSRIINNLEKTQATLQPSGSPEDKPPAQPAPMFPVWVSVGAGALAVIVALTVLLSLKKGIGRLDAAIGVASKQSGAELAVIGKDVKAVRGVVGETPLKDALLPQFKSLSDALRSLDGKVGGFDRPIRDIPGQFDAVAKTISRDAETHRSSIFAWLFGRGKTQAPESGFARQIEDRIGEFQTAVLAAVETDRKLQARKLELDERERRLDERTRSLDAECAKARAEGAAAAERRAAAQEAANKALAENMTAKAAEFGKKVAALEIERDGAKTAARKAEAAGAEAKRQADEATKVRARLTADVSRLSMELSKRDQTRESELAKARDEIRGRLEQANAEELAGLRAEVKAARDERDKATKSAETMRVEKSAVEAELAAAKSSLEAEKVARESDRDSAARELAAEKAARNAERENAERTLASVSAERDAARSRVFPDEFSGDSAFEPLLAQLDAWDADGAPGASLARASLAIFADRKNLPANIWQRALGDLSLGLAAAMDAAKMAPVDIVSSLGSWKTAIERRAAGGPSFSLNLPSVGAKVDTSWMNAKSGAATVRRVLSWAVYGQSGNAYMAKVE